MSIGASAKLLFTFLQTFKGQMVAQCQGSRRIGNALEALIYYLRSLGGRGVAQMRAQYIAYVVTMTS